MTNSYLISTQTICSNYEIEYSFVETLHTMGLIQIEVIEQKQFIHRDHINDLERIIRLHSELNVNLEGIDIVLNLLQKEEELLQEMKSLKNRLRLYESD